MAKLGFIDCFNYARMAGFTEGQSLVMAGIAMAESSGVTDVSVMDTNGYTSYGLWQINGIHGKEILGIGDWRDPAINARMAHMVFNKQGFKAWTTYTRKQSFPDGGYGTPAERKIAEYLASSGTVGNIGAGMAAGIGGAAGAGGQAIGDVGAAGTEALAEWTQEQTLFQLGEFLRFIATPANWLRVGKVVVGGALVVAGAYVVVSSNRK